MSEGTDTTKAGGNEPAPSGLSAVEWQAVVSAVREGVVVHDTDGRIVSANEAAGRILGLTTEQLLGLDSMDPRWQATRADGSPFPGEDHPAMVALHTGEPVTDEIMGVDVPDDGRRWIRVSARPLRTPDAPRRVVATFVDITAEREREIEYRALAESTSDLVARVSDGVVEYASPEARRVLGALQGTDAASTVERVCHPDDYAAFVAAMQDLDEQRTTSPNLDLRLRTVEGDLRWFDTRVWRADGVPGVVAVARDITDRKSMERQLADAEELFRQAFDEAPIGMAMTAIEQVDMPTVLRANRRYAAAFGCTVEEIIGRSAREFTHPDDREASIAARARLLNGETTHERMHVRIRRLDGSTPWHVLTRTLLRDQAGAPRYILAQLEDASAAHDMVSRLAVMAHTDPLTGLINRRGLEVELAAVLEDPYAMAHTGVLFLDLDGFKTVNDRLGHSAGDDALRHVADRLTLLTRGHDTVARLGGDEFVVIARHLGGEATLRRVAERLSTVLFEEAGDPPIVVRASIGTTRPRPGDDAAAVIDRADRDMYRHKRGAAR